MAPNNHSYYDTLLVNIFFSPSSISLYVITYNNVTDTIRLISSMFSIPCIYIFSLFVVSCLERDKYQVATADCVARQRYISRSSLLLRCQCYLCAKTLATIIITYCVSIAKLFYFDFPCTILSVLSILLTLSDTQ